MVIELEKLLENRDLLATVGSANGVTEAKGAWTALSAEHKRLLSELKNLEEADWVELLSAARGIDVELCAIMQAAKQAIRLVDVDVDEDEPFKFSSRIVALTASPYLGLRSRTPIIRIVFTSQGNESFISDQDLEDSLWVGASVIECVAESIQFMVEEFGISPEHISLGIKFGAHLESAEKATTTIRKLLDEGNAQEE